MSSEKNNSAAQLPFADLPREADKQGFQSFQTDKKSVLNIAEMSEVKGGRNAGSRFFTSVFSWNASCGGPMPQ